MHAAYALALAILPYITPCQRQSQSQDRSQSQSQTPVELHNEEMKNRKGLYHSNAASDCQGFSNNLLCSHGHIVTTCRRWNLESFTSCLRSAHQCQALLTTTCNCTCLLRRLWSVNAPIDKRERSVTELNSWSIQSLYGNVMQ